MKEKKSQLTPTLNLILILTSVLSFWSAWMWKRVEINNEEEKEAEDESECFKGGAG